LWPRKIRTTLVEDRDKAILGELFPCTGGHGSIRDPGHAMMLLRAGIVLAGALLFFALCLSASSARDQPTALAIVDFDYNDTSGEPADQNAIHQSRLKAFMQAIRSDLAASGKFSLVALSCGSDPCSIMQTPSAEILDKARQAGARLLLFGGIHKMSTLIQWAKIQAVDLKTEKLVFDRLLTFRGDTDDAWKRAEVFVAEQMTTLAVEK